MKLLPYVLATMLAAPAYSATLHDFVKQKSDEFKNTKQGEKGTTYAILVKAPEGYEKVILRYNELKDGSKFFITELYKKNADTIEAIILSDKNADKSAEKYTRATAATAEEAVKAAYKAKSIEAPAELAATHEKLLSDLETIAVKE